MQAQTRKPQARDALLIYCHDQHHRYGWHFPELVKMVNDNYQYARLVRLIGDRNTLKDEQLSDINNITMDEEMSKKARPLFGHVSHFVFEALLHLKWGAERSEGDRP